MTTTPPEAPRPADNEPERAPSRHWLRRIATAAATAGVLLLVVGYIALATGLGQGLTPPLKTALKMATVLVAVGFIAQLLGRHIAARVAQAGVVAIVIGVMMVEDRRIAAIHEKSADERVTKNELLLASALARVPCKNGDIATLQMLSRPKDDFHSLSIQIVPADRRGFSNLLVSAHGKFKPPMDDNIRAYKRSTGTECSSPDYPSLDAMFQRVAQHHEKERPKYEKKE